MGSIFAFGIGVEVCGQSRFSSESFKIFETLAASGMHPDSRGKEHLSLTVKRRSIKLKFGFVTRYGVTKREIEPR